MFLQDHLKILSLFWGQEPRGASEEGIPPSGLWGWPEEMHPPSVLDACFTFQTNMFEQKMQDTHITAKAASLRIWKQAELGAVKFFLQKERDAGRYEPVWPGLD